jgi:hypothetical protein
MGNRAPEIDQTLNRLRSDIERQQQTIQTLKRDGHVTADAEKHLGELIDSARVMDSAPCRPD